MNKRTNTKAERKPAKSANSEQRFTISEIEQAKADGYTAGFAAGQTAMTAELNAAGMLAKFRGWRSGKNAAVIASAFV